MRHSISEYLLEALPRTDSRGRFSTEDARVLKSLVARARGAPGSDLLSPEQLFGPWPSLPTHVRVYLRSLAAAEMRGTMAFHLRGRIWRWSARPSIADLLAALGKPPQWLMGGFAEGVTVDRRCRGFFHDRGRNVVYGYLLGIDLVPTPSGVICHEANLNAGIFERTRRPLIPGSTVNSGTVSPTRAAVPAESPAS